MRCEKTELEGVMLITPDVFEDDRGFFTESYSKRRYAELGINCEFVQDNRSLSIKKDTIRGIHFQLSPFAQAKLITCVQGEIMDVAVDLRHESPTYLKWQSFVLSGTDKRQLFIPKGFGHAFLTLCDNCLVEYKTDEFYNPEYEAALSWNDPRINISWGILSPILSAKDASAQNIKDGDIFF